MKKLHLSYVLSKVVFEYPCITSRFPTSHQNVDLSNSASRGRIYLPQDELAQAGLSDDDIFAGKVTDKWRNFMKSQIKRARMCFNEAEKGVTELDEASRWPVRYQKPSIFLEYLRSVLRF